MKYQIMNQLLTEKIIVVVRGQTDMQAIKMTEACINGGLKAIEITFTTPKAGEVIADITGEHNELTVGAGTVLDSETARIAILAGAKFIVSPAFDQGTAKLCNRYDIPYIPGIMTVREALMTLEYGVNIVKLFPSNNYDPSFIKALKAPLPMLNIMPTGGVNLDNIHRWFESGAAMAGVGSEITSPALRGDYAAVEELARLYSKAVKGE